MKTTVTTLLLVSASAFFLLNQQATAMIDKPSGGAPAHASRVRIIPPTPTTINTKGRWTLHAEKDVLGAAPTTYTAFTWQGEVDDDGDDDGRTWTLDAQMLGYKCDRSKPVVVTGEAAPYLSARPVLDSDKWRIVAQYEGEKHTKMEYPLKGPHVFASCLIKSKDVKLSKDRTSWEIVSK